MSDHERTLERVRRASHRLALADLERTAAMDAATEAIQALDDVPAERLARELGLSSLTIEALRARRSTRHRTRKPGARLRVLGGRGAGAG